MDKGKEEKGIGGRPKKSVAEKMERVTVFIPSLLVSRYPPLRIRELVVLDSEGIGASEVPCEVEAVAPKSVPSGGIDVARAVLRSVEEKVGLTKPEQPFGETGTTVRTHGLSPIRVKLAKRFNDLLMCPHIDEVMIGRWVEEGILMAEGDS